MKKRCDSIAFKLMPDGNIRGYRSNKPDKPGATEWQITDPDNPSPTLISATPPKIIEYEYDKNLWHI